MTFLGSVGGMVKAQLTSADPVAAMRSIEKANISLENIETDGNFQLTFSLSRKNWKRLEDLANRRGDSLVIKERNGLFWRIRGIFGRPVLLLGIVCLFILSLWLPSRVLFVQVEGNHQVYTNQILEQASYCGIRFGASRKDVRSEAMKNALLERMPQLHWAGVNTYGCVAVITVEESAPEPKHEKSACVSSIVAQIDGIIRSLTVIKGTACCHVGDRIKAGEVLISGITDNGTVIRVTDAAGEVFADTIRQLTAFAPAESVSRLEQGHTSAKYGLLIGKKRINFNNNSGISDTGCVRIYWEQYITLPGGFVLPVGIYREKWVSYQTQSSSGNSEEEWLRGYVKDYLKSQMIGGQIITSVVTVTDLKEVIRMDGIFGCYEMIGISRAEENYLDYEDH